MPYPELAAPTGVARAIARPLKRRIATEVASLFNDTARGERPVTRRPDGLFGPGAVAWRVHGDVAAMMVGGVTGLLLQMLHPKVLAGVWDHSTFRTDLHGRLRRTARFIAQTTYSSRAEAEDAIARVRRIHAHVRGALPDGTPYRADAPDLLAWVHVTETTSFLASWIRYAEPGMSRAEQDRYFAEMAVIGRMLGAAPVAETKAAAREIVAAMRPALRADARSREVVALLLRRRQGNTVVAPVMALNAQAAVDLLPDWARRLHGLASPLAPGLVRAGTYGVASALRWAFA